MGNVDGMGIGIVISAFSWSAAGRVLPGCFRVQLHAAHTGISFSLTGSTVIAHYLVQEEGPVLLIGDGCLPYHTLGSEGPGLHLSGAKLVSSLQYLV